MTDDLIPRMPSPAIREKFRRTAKELCKRDGQAGAPLPFNLQSNRMSASGDTKSATNCATKSSAQVAPFVLPQQKAGGLKPDGSTGGNVGGSTKPAKRSTPMGVRLTEEQKDIIRERAREAGCNVNEYIRSLVLEGSYRSPLPPDVYRELLACKLELTRQGHNLNQIAKQLNAGLMDDDEALHQLNELAPSLLAAHRALHGVLTNGRTGY